MMVDSFYARITARAFVVFLCTGFFMLSAPAAAGEITVRDADAILATVQRNLSEADAMADTLRGDVYSAVLSGTHGHTDYLKAVQSEFATHAKIVEARLAANHTLAVDQPLRSGLQVLQGPFDTYFRAAEDLIAVAGDPEKALAKLQGFQEAFDALEKPMNAVADLIEAQARQRKHALEPNARVAQAAVSSATWLGLALLSILAIALSYHQHRRRHAPQPTDGAAAAYSA